MHWRRCLPRALVPLALTTLLSIGCGEGRFPICHSNEDCQARDAGATGGVCYNLRCVECRYDTDCPAGKVCGTTGTCEGLTAAKQPDPDDTPKVDAGSGPLEPLNWDECAKGCKDQTCLNQCDAKFHPAK